jgi:hypothetical protein
LSERSLYWSVEGSTTNLAVLESDINVIIQDQVIAKGAPQDERQGTRRPIGRVPRSNQTDSSSVPEEKLANSNRWAVANGLNNIVPGVNVHPEEAAHDPLLTHLQEMESLAIPEQQGKSIFQAGPDEHRVQMYIDAGGEITETSACQIKILGHPFSLGDPRFHVLPHGNPELVELDAQIAERVLAADRVAIDPVSGLTGRDHHTLGRAEPVASLQGVCLADRQQAVQIGSGMSYQSNVVRIEEAIDATIVMRKTIL